MLIIIIKIMALAAHVSSYRLTINGPDVKGAYGSNCGSQSGGVRLIVYGTGFDKSINMAVAVKHQPAAADGWANSPDEWANSPDERANSPDEWVPCMLTERDDQRATCVTGAAAGPSSGPGHVLVKFDRGLATVPAFRFTYVADPAIEAGQLPWGIRAGGTRVPVALANEWKCVDQVKFYAVDDDGRRYNGDDFCSPVTGGPSVMVCPTPLLPQPDAPAAASIAAADDLYTCGFDMRYAGQPWTVPCAPPSYYHLHDDPQFTYFDSVLVPDSDPPRTLFVVYGPDLALGFLAEDVTVHFPYGRHDDVICDLKLMDTDRIECLPPVYVDAALVPEVTVLVGNAQTKVPRRHTDVFGFGLIE